MMWVRPVGRLPDDAIEEGRQAGAHINLSLKSPWQLFAAWEGETLLGWVGLLLRSANSATIRGWYVKPDHRGKGVGSALLDASVQWVWESGRDKVEIRTAHDVEWAGFRPSGYSKISPPYEKHYRRTRQEALCVNT